MFGIKEKQDLTGKIYNNWKVLYKDENKIDRNTRWICECQCEKKTIKSISTHELTSGISKSCGCQNNYAKFEDKIFGNLKVLKKSEEKNRDGSFLWECECQCENKTILKLTTSQLKTRKNLSCGCQVVKRADYTRQHKDLTGMIINRWKVLREVERNEKGKIQWLCECSCEKHTLKKITSDRLLSGDSKSCGCLLGIIDLKEGEMFGRWKVLKKDESKNGNYYICECQCKDKTVKSVKATSLKDGKTNSCGCSTREKKRKYNTYNLSGEYGIGWTTNTNKEFFFDLEDYDLIKNWCWIEDKELGYISTRESRKTTHKVIPMHRMVMGVTDGKIEVDHIYHQTNDNRKSQLRLVTKAQNQYNRSISKYNTSGVKGVSWSNKENKWRAYITIDLHRIEKRFDTFEEAVEYRKYLEEKYHGEFAYQEPPQEYIEELKQISETI